MVVHLPDEFTALIDERRGVITRTQYVINMLAAQLGIEAPIMLRGRPRKTTPEDTSPVMQAIDYIGRIGRDDDDYRKAWHRRLFAAGDALEAMGLTMDSATLERLVCEQHAEFPHYHPTER